MSLLDVPRASWALLARNNEQVVATRPIRIESVVVRSTQPRTRAATQFCSNRHHAEMVIRVGIYVLWLARLLRQTSGHGAVVYPPPRNAVDSDILPWSGPVPQHPPGVESATGWCPAWSEREGKISGQNGQACFWVRYSAPNATSRD